MKNKLGTLKLDLTKNNLNGCDTIVNYTQLLSTIQKLFQIRNLHQEIIISKSEGKGQTQNTKMTSIPHRSQHPLPSWYTMSQNWPLMLQSASPSTSKLGTGLLSPLISQQRPVSAQWEFPQKSGLQSTSANQSLASCSKLYLFQQKSQHSLYTLQWSLCLSSRNYWTSSSQQDSILSGPSR